MLAVLAVLALVSKVCKPSAPSAGWLAYLRTVNARLTSGSMEVAGSGALPAGPGALPGELALVAPRLDAGQQVPDQQHLQLLELQAQVPEDALHPQARQGNGGGRRWRCGGGADPGTSDAALHLSSQACHQAPPAFSWCMRYLLTNAPPAAADR